MRPENITVTITIPPTLGYDITKDEKITFTVPVTALEGINQLGDMGFLEGSFVITAQN